MTHAVIFTTYRLKSAPPFYPRYPYCDFFLFFFVEDLEIISEPVLLQNVPLFAPESENLSLIAPQSENLLLTALQSDLLCSTEIVRHHFQHWCSVSRTHHTYYGEQQFLNHLDMWHPLLNRAFNGTTDGNTLTPNTMSVTWQAKYEPQAHNIIKIEDSVPPLFACVELQVHDSDSDTEFE